MDITGKEGEQQEDRLDHAVETSATEKPETAGEKNGNWIRNWREPGT